MKKLLLFAFILAIETSLAQTNIPSAKAGQTYGEVISADNAISIDKVAALLKTTDSYQGKIEGKVVEVCKKKGCFIKIKQNEGDAIMVKFKDYSFFMPQDIIGKTIIMDGIAKVNLTSVERLKHYAQDAGKSQNEINKITEAKKSVNILASGVIVK